MPTTCKPSSMNTASMASWCVPRPRSVGLIDACPNLKFIGRGGVGMDNIDVEYARNQGIAVFNTPAASSQSVAELVMGHLFALARFQHDSNRQMPARGAGEFKALKKAYGKGTELRGKTLGILGFGRIGRSLASYALGCGMNVVAHDPFVTNGNVHVAVGGQTITVDCPRLSLDELLGSSDMVSVHVPAQADGSAVIGAAELAKMKPGSFLANAARGGSVDEDALLGRWILGTSQVLPWTCLSGNQRRAPTCWRIPSWR